MPYFGEPVGRVKIQTTTKNSRRYYTTKRLIRDLLSNTPKFYVCVGEFYGYLFTGNALYLYSPRVLFVLNEVQLDNKYRYKLLAQHIVK